MSFIHINLQRTEATVILQPTSDSDWIEQSPASGQSYVSFAAEASKILEGTEHGRLLSLTSVYVNGIATPFVAASRTAFHVSPMLSLNGERLVLTCALLPSPTR